MTPLEVLTSVLIPLKKNFLFIVMTMMMTMVAETKMFDAMKWRGFYEDTYMETFLDIYIISIILSLLPSLWRKIFHFIIYTLLAGVTIVDIFCVAKFNSHITPTMIMLANETDGREAGEFLETYVTNDVVFESPIFYILIISAIYVVVALPWKNIASCIRKRRKTKSQNQGFFNSQNKIFSVLRLYAEYPATKIVLSLIVLGFTGICIGCTAFNKKQAWRLFTMSTIGDVEHELTTPDQARLYGSAERLAFSLRANALTDEQIDILNKIRKDLKVDGCSFRSPNIILIIGEAYCRAHSQLYGYEKETTPEQAKMEKNGQLVKFTNVVSPWNLTSYVFKHIMTTYTVGDEGDWCNYPLFCELFRLGGYNVRFLTDEFMSKPTEAVYDFSGGFFINDPELSAAQFDERNSHLNKYDEGLLKDYDDIEKTSKNKDKKGHLTIFHLIGQHVSYVDRFPDGHSYFKSDDYDYRKELTDQKWKSNIACYDNATRYNDSIVSLIVRKFADDNTIVIYMPDHGEEVHPKEAPSHFGRYHSAKIDKVLAREEFTIPFWIWCSKKYIASHHDIFNEIKAAANKPYMTDALPHLMLYLAGIQCKYYREDRNILSPKYDVHRKRIIKHEADYDEIMGN